MDLNEPSSSKWSSTTSIKFKHVRPLNCNGRSHVYPMAFVTDRVLASAECSTYSYPSCSSPQFSF
ncbi:outer envelope protein 80 [Pyrus ussuriensis x Pyrus communis]|uniref:Outer envelope protein 80 n=1 Tax=Pyrus ussuriensis x Pyrus communis TaxID=2448454 RepID=A0A5N5GPL0_9ROSA|nr:outer envelope protein 80 [Pyrus ussuriensis x Pyrus communis]